jgi:hypothetical protein
MNNADSPTRKDQDQKQEYFYLPEFFQKEFPNLSKFVKENLIDKYSRKTRPE